MNFFESKNPDGEVWRRYRQEVMRPSAEPETEGEAEREVRAMREGNERRRVK